MVVEPLLRSVDLHGTLADTRSVAGVLCSAYKDAVKQFNANEDDVVVALESYQLHKNKTKGKGHTQLAAVPTCIAWSGLSQRIGEIMLTG